MKTEFEKLQDLREKQHSLLTSTFTDDKQFKYLGDLLDTEIELEKYCNQ